MSIDMNTAAEINFHANVMRRDSWQFLAAFSIIILMLGWSFHTLNEVSVSNYELLKEHLGAPFSLLRGMSVGVDQADVQWKDLVKNLPLLGPFLLVVALGARTLRSRYAIADGPAHNGRNPTCSNAIQMYYVVTGLLFLLYLHGAPFFFEITLILINFYGIAPLCKKVPFKAFMLIMWTSHVAILFVNDHYKGYRFSLFFSGLRWVDESMPSGVLRWSVVFNMCTLRMIAYNNDYYEAIQVHNNGGIVQGRHPQLLSEKIEKHLQTCIDCAALRTASGTISTTTAMPTFDVSLHCYKLRTETPRPLAEYNLKGYLAYLFYVPLYVAGPMSSYNAFISHTHVATRSMNLKQGLIYALRVVMLFTLLQFQLHFNFLNAIREQHDVFDSMTIAQKLAFFLFTLGFLWMKFNFLWKFFRLVAFVDGVESPEDMNRCFSDTLTIQSFWKDWHSSFNLWIVRYMYIPMGGSKNRLLSIFPIFVFIAVWHDIELRLLWWAMIMCVCFIPEVLVGLFMSRPQMKWLRAKPYYRYLRALGGAAGMFVLITANLVGYGTGTRNVGKGLAEVLTWETVEVVLAVFIVLYSGAIIAVRDRDAKDAEKRRLKVLYNIKAERAD